MALETLKNIREIGGFKLNHEPEKGLAEDDYIVVDHVKNAVGIKFQNGPIKENGVNGAQVDTAISLCQQILKGLNKNFPCVENEIAITGLGKAMTALKDRTRNREARGVEGTNKA